MKPGGFEHEKQLFDAVAASEKLVEKPPPVFDPVFKTERFRGELEKLINAHSMESYSDTPDFILAEYLVDCLKAFDRASKRREEWYATN